MISENIRPRHAAAEALDDGDRAQAAEAVPNAPQNARESETLRRASCIKALRRATGLTQEEFCARFRIPLGTLRDWEQGRSEPDKPAKAYLRAIAGDSAAVSRALEIGPH
jgi:putative transcriptional regulator